MNTDNDRLGTLKQRYIEYYSDVPVQKYAAMAIGRNEDTIIRWRNEDSEFADAVQMAKAEWVRKRVLATKAEFALERLEKDVFSARGGESSSSSSDSAEAERLEYIRNMSEEELTNKILADFESLAAENGWRVIKDGSTAQV